MSDIFSEQMLGEAEKQLTVPFKDLYEYYQR